jgi:hypothetical protein
VVDEIAPVAVNGNIETEAENVTVITSILVKGLEVVKGSFESEDE